MRPGIGYLIAVTVTVTVLSSQVAQACLPPYGFLDFEPQPLIATIITLRWDMWINGAAEENIGDLQRLYVYLGAVCIVLGAIISLVDVFQHRRDNP